VKILKRVLIGLVVFLVLFFVAAYVTVKVAFPPEKVGALISREGSKLLGRPVTIGSVAVRVFPSIRIAVDDVRLANDSGFSEEPAVTLKRLDLAVSLWSLLRFSPVIHQVRLVEPDILFEMDSTGRNNLESLGAADTAAQEDSVLTLPANVALESFRLENGRVRYRETGSGREVVLGRIDQEASLTLDKHLRDVRTQGRLEISEISVLDSGLGLRKGGVKITVSHDLRADVPGDSLRIVSMALSFQDVKATLEGSVRAMTSPSPVVDLHFAAPSVSLASLLKEIPQGLSAEIRKFRAAGTASLDARVQGVVDSVSTPSIFADVTVREGAFGHKDVPQGIEKFTMDLKVRVDTAILENLAFNAGPNPVRMSARASSILDSIPLLERLRVDGTFDLGNLTALAREMGLLDTGLSVKGVATLALSASGPVDAARPERLTVSGKSVLKNVNVAMSGLPPVKANGDADFTNEKITAKVKALIGRSDASVDLQLSDYLGFVLDQKGAKRPRAKVDVRSGLVDLDEFLDIQPAAEEAADPMTAWPEWPPVDADLTVALARTKLLGLEMTNFNLKTTLREKSAQTDLKGSLYSGGFSSAVTLTPRTPADMGVGFKLRVARVQANDFISRLNDHVPLKNKLLKSLAGTDNSVYGKFDLDMDLVTGGLPAQFAERANGTTRFSVTEGKLVGIAWTRSLSGALAKVHSSLGFQEFNFSAVRGDLALEKGTILVKDFSFDAARAGSARATGRVGLDNSLNLTLTHTLPPDASKAVAGGSSAVLSQIAKLSGSNAAGGSLLPTDASGRALVYYLVRGEVTSPSFGLDAQRMAKEGAAGAAAASAKEAVQARAQAEKEKLEAQAKTRIEAEKKKAKEEGVKKGKKVLKDLGF
jgi:uncharacterized protein involved in outer membrane biogenesis